MRRYTLWRDITTADGVYTQVSSLLFTFAYFLLLSCHYFDFILRYSFTFQFCLFFLALLCLIICFSFIFVNDFSFDLYGISVPLRSPSLLLELTFCICFLWLLLFSFCFRAVFFVFRPRQKIPSVGWYVCRFFFAFVAF